MFVCKRPFNLIKRKQKSKKKNYSNKHRLGSWIFKEKTALRIEVEGGTIILSMHLLYFVLPYIYIKLTKKTKKTRSSAEI